MALPELKSNILPDNEIITVHTNDGAEVFSQVQQSGNTVDSLVSTGAQVYTTHNVVPQVVTVLKENGQDITTVVDGFWDVVWSVNGQTGDVTIDAVVGDFIPGNTYRKGAAIYHNGDLYTAVRDFTAAQTFDETDWNRIVVRSRPTITSADATLDVTTTEDAVDLSIATALAGVDASVNAKLQAKLDVYYNANTDRTSTTDRANALLHVITTLITNGFGYATIRYAGGYYYKYYVMSGIASAENAILEVNGYDGKIMLWSANNTKTTIRITKTFDDDAIAAAKTYVDGLVTALGARTTAIEGKIPAQATASNQLADKAFVTNSVATLGARTTAIENKIPSQAAASNQLADKAFVNSSVQTATANFRGNWGTWSSVPTDASLYPEDYTGLRVPTVNDYMVVVDASGVVRPDGRNLFSGKWAQFDNAGGTGSTYAYFRLPDDGAYTLTLYAKDDFTGTSRTYLGFSANGGESTGGTKWVFSSGTSAHAGDVISITNYRTSTSNYPFLSIYTNDETTLETFLEHFNIQLERGSEPSPYEPPTGELEGTWRFKYNGVWETVGKSGWKPEYQVNETPMTAAQLAALNSGITFSKIAGINSELDSLGADIVSLGDNKVDKVAGKSLSTNDYSNAAKAKLDSIVGETWTFTLSDGTTVSKTILSW